jgi:hypothetical protein
VLLVLLLLLLFYVCRLRAEHRPVRHLHME